MRCLACALVLAASLGSVAHADARELLGHPAPPIQARQLTSDDELDLASYRGRVVVVVFFATWCEACGRLAPQLEALHDQYGARGLSVLAFSTEPRNRILRLLEREPRRYNTAQCTGRTARRYYADALPTMVLVDRDGIVRGVYQSAAYEVVFGLRRELRRLFP